MIFFIFRGDFCFWGTQNLDYCPMYSESIDETGGLYMEQQKVIDEIEYFKAQKLTDQLYENGFLSFVEYDKLTELNRRSFSPLFSDLLPKVLDKSSKKR